ncbi:MAG: glutaredoxin [Myxococcales bacterium]|nr:glutaredoxin [Myxococcales bacterium]
MARPVLALKYIHPAVKDAVVDHFADTLREIQDAIAKHDVVVVGMAQNPHPKRARAALDAAGVAHHDLDYGSYFSEWRRRTAIKMWSGWPTFPMVFVRGVLVGGASDLKKLIDAGELKALLDAPRAG